MMAKPQDYDTEDDTDHKNDICTAVGAGPGAKSCNSYKCSKKVPTYYRYSIYMNIRPCPSTHKRYGAENLTNMSYIQFAQASKVPGLISRIQDRFHMENAIIID